MPSDEDNSVNSVLLTSPFPYEDCNQDELDQLLRTPKHQTGTKSKAKPLPNNTPITRTTNSARDLLLEQDAEARQERFCSEFRKWCVGPMPIKMFLQDFLPPDTAEKCSGNKDNYFKSVPTPGSKDSEDILYKPLVFIFYRKHCLGLK